MTPCPDSGRLRALLDGMLAPAAAAALAAHLTACPACRARLAALRQSADFAGQALALLGAAPDPATTRRAWGRLQARLDERPRPPSLRERITAMLDRFASRSARLGLSAGLAGLAVVLTLALTPLGSEAAKALSIFRITTFKAITFEVDQSSLPRPTDAQRQQLERRRQASDPAAVRAEIERELAAVGIALNTTVTDRTVRAVKDLAAARAAAPAGTTVRTITALPAALKQGAPKVYVADPSKTVVTADLARVRQALRERAKELPKGAPAIDPTNLPGIDPNVSSIAATLQTAFSVVQVWGEEEKTLVFAHGASPVLTLSEGIDITALRDALVASPAISKTTRTQIMSIRDDEWNKTLFIPVPAGAIVKDVRVGGLLGVGGEPALLILTPDGQAGAVFWRTGDTLYVVAGGYGEDVLMQAANSVK